MCLVHPHINPLQTHHYPSLTPDSSPHPFTPHPFTQAREGARVELQAATEAVKRFMNAFEEDTSEFRPEYSRRVAQVRLTDCGTDWWTDRLID